jgi:hypothetical protein
MAEFTVVRVPGQRKVNKKLNPIKINMVEFTVVRAPGQ